MPTLPVMIRPTKRNLRETAQETTTSTQYCNELEIYPNEKEPVNYRPNVTRCFLNREVIGIVSVKCLNFAAKKVRHLDSRWVRDFYGYRRYVL